MIRSTVLVLVALFAISTAYNIIDRPKQLTSSKTWRERFRGYPGRQFDLELDFFTLNSKLSPKCCDFYSFFLCFFTFFIFFLIFQNFSTFFSIFAPFLSFFTIFTHFSLFLLIFHYFYSFFPFFFCFFLSFPTFLHFSNSSDSVHECRAVGLSRTSCPHRYVLQRSLRPDPELTTLPILHVRTIIHSFPCEIADNRWR